MLEKWNNLSRKDKTVYLGGGIILLGIIITFFITRT